MLQDDIRIPPAGYRSAPSRRAAESRRMMLAAGGIGAVLAIGLVGYVVAGGDGPQPVPVIQAPAGPVMVKPADPGGLQVNTQTNALLSNGGSSTDASLAPAPETPDPAALAAAAQQEQASLPTLAPPPSAAAPAAPAAAAPALAPAGAPAPAQDAGTMAGATAAPPPPPPAPAAPVPTQAVAVPTIPETPAAPSPERMAMTIPPPSRTAAAVHNLAQEYVPPQYTPPSLRHEGHGHVRVQLAALDSREAALRAWDHLAHRMPALLGGRRPIFEEAHVNGHIYWRVRTSGFASSSEANQFCDEVRNQGGACTLATF